MIERRELKDHETVIEWRSNDPATALQRISPRIMGHGHSGGMTLQFK